MLLRVLPSVYPKQPDAINRHLGNLMAMMSQLASPEQQHLLRLIQMVAVQKPLVSVCECVYGSRTPWNTEKLWNIISD